MNPLSIYIHWPFCLSLCPYCDFNSHVASTIDHTKWLEGYKTELGYFAEKIKGKEIKSIFFGGGTPSLMKPFVIEGIINKIANLGLVSDATEITLEANPTSYETEKFKEFKSCGINRVSIGVQSFIEHDLKTLGRMHSSNEAISAIKSASTIFSRFSFDLIYTRPGQTLQSWQEEIKFATQLADGHISLYQLTIEKGTPFFKLFLDGKMRLPSNDDSASMYEWTNYYLNSKGYRRYEISNYAKKGQECLHNLCYWNYDEYLGIGPGAHSRLHSKISIQSLMMLHRPNKWLEAVFEKGHGIQNQTNLTKIEIIEEALMMGTRLEAGISESKFKKLIGLSFDEILDQKTTTHYINQGLVTRENNKLTLTNKGLILHNYLVPRMLAN